MKRLALLVLAIAIAAGALAAVAWVGRATAPRAGSSSEPAAAAPGTGRSGKPLFYRHPMRPDVTSPSPAKDEMGMDYIPVYEDDLGSGEGGEVPGHAPFSLSAERQQLIGVKTGVVERRPLEVDIETVGKVAYDPGLYQALIEYREALRARRGLQDSDMHEARAGSDALVRAAALKLRQQGVSEAQIRDLTAEGRDPTNLLLPGKSVWIYVQVYEYEVELVHPGQEMRITAPSLPGRTFHAKVAAVDPILNATTRTVRVRALAATPDESCGRRPSSMPASTSRSASTSRCRRTRCSTPATVRSSSSSRARARSSRAPSGSDAKPRASTRSWRDSSPARAS